jgi:hypothetical protein
MRRSSPALCLCVLTLAAASCGKVKTFADGPTGADAPAAADAGPDADPRGTVHVTVIDNNGTGAPVVNAPVVFFDPDGTMVADVKTDGSGQAQADVLPGANATAIWPLPNNAFQLMTIYAIEPGDDITFGYTSTTSTADGQFTVSNVPTYSGASSYTVYGPCGSAPVQAGAPVATLDLYTDCKGLSTDLVVIARDANSAVIASLTKTGVTYTSGGSISLTGTTYAFAQTFTANYTNIPPGVTDIDLSRNSAFLNGPQSSTTGSPSGTTLTLSLPSSPGAGTSAFISSVFSKSPAQQILRQRVAGNSFTYGDDVGANLMPWIEGPVADPTTQIVPQPQPGMGVTPDVYGVDFQYGRADGSASFEWVLFAATPHPLTLPALPGDVPAGNLQATDTIGFSTAILLETSDIDGYGAARQAPLDLFRSHAFGNATPDTVRVETASSGN